LSTPHKAALTGLGTLELDFDIDELCSYTKARLVGLAPKSKDWIKRAAKSFWGNTFGSINKQSMDRLRNQVLAKYQSQWSKSKTVAFAKAFLKFLSKTRLDTRYQAFAIFLELPRTVKERKNVTNRIITKDDITGVLKHIRSAHSRGKISRYKSLQYAAFVLFGAYTGQRSVATMAKLTVGQFKEALSQEKTALNVHSKQDKIRMEHYVPLHPHLIKAIQLLEKGRNDEELMFEYGNISMWIKRQKIPLLRIKNHFVLGDLRKFTEQFGDIIQWDQSNRAYIMTHGVSGIDWKHYKHPLPENVYDVYMQYWEDIEF
jgi:integrase